MEDYEIVALYWKRSPDALPCAQGKYGSMLMHLAESLLRIRQDAEECVNDTLLASWNAIPPDRPNYLGAYLSKIARRICISSFRRSHAAKRSGITVAMNELVESLPDSGEVFDAMEQDRLREVLNGFLASLRSEHRRLFLLRYFFGKSIREIAQETDMSEGAVKTALFRIRQSLKSELEREALM